jgi:hypothetical protein
MFGYPWPGPQRRQCSLAASRPGTGRSTGWSADMYDLTEEEIGIEKAAKRRGSTIIGLGDKGKDNLQHMDYL